MSVQSLKYQLANLSTRAALTTLINKYGRANSEFIFDGKSFTVRSALATFENLLLDMPCGQVGYIRFFGGPPHRGRWVDGSILTMLCDAILFEENTKGWSDAERSYA